MRSRGKCVSNRPFCLQTRLFVLVFCLPATQTCPLIPCPIHLTGVGPSPQQCNSICRKTSNVKRLANQLQSSAPSCQMTLECKYCFFFTIQLSSLVRKDEAVTNELEQKKKKEKKRLLQLDSLDQIHYLTGTLKQHIPTNAVPGIVLSQAPTFIVPHHRQLRRRLSRGRRSNQAD